MPTGLSIRVRGTVQGVGFRPFVFRLAARHGLTGWVRNTAGVVEIEIDGPTDTLDAFLHELRDQAPAVARIDEVVTTSRPSAGYESFEILVSQVDEGWQAVSPDIATCDSCLEEMLNPCDRRYRYPFTNCTNCGPRFTIIESLPYDRPRTTMRHFAMCEECSREFLDPRDRRFHAQPIACPACGPRVWLHIPNSFVPDGDPISQGAQLLRDGSILALKGLGGFQLACDATSEEAVANLRVRKHRYGKPFAIMVDSAESAEKLAEFTEEAKALLTSRHRPIVVAHSHTRTLAHSLTAGLDTIGIMLPYTPLHHLLLREAGIPLVMTSGNQSEEPIAIGNEEALRRLAPIADAFLLHNRDIYARYDDSVIRVSEVGATQLRRARSMAPAPIDLPFNASIDILAVGPQQKNTFCLVKGTQAFVSQHIGDLDTVETSDAYCETLDLYTRLFKVEPKVIAHDLHPDYFTTRLAREFNDRHALRVAVQHHHAHIVSCMAEHGIEDRVIGVAYDGTGFGTDAAIWGSEVMVATWHGFERAAHLRYTPLLGGDAAVRNPLRMAAAHIWSLTDGRVHGFDSFFNGIRASELAVWRKQFESGFNAPPTSSCGRLFDAVAALIGLRTAAVYEGQPAVELEAIADRDVEDAYPFVIDVTGTTRIIDPSAMLRAVWSDFRSGRPLPEISGTFHNTVARWTVEAARLVRDRTGLNQVCLTGGCFQNALLTARALWGLQEMGFEVFMPQQLPPNDGGVSLGQAVVAYAIAAS